MPFPDPKPVHRDRIGSRWDQRPAKVIVTDSDTRPAHSSKPKINHICYKKQFWSSGELHLHKPHLASQVWISSYFKLPMHISVILSRSSQPNPQLFVDPSILCIGDWRVQGITRENWTASRKLNATCICRNSAVGSRKDSRMAHLL